MESNIFYIFTDGSALNNSSTSFAGCAVYFPNINKIFSKSLKGTNNIAELSAIEYALWYVNKHILLKIESTYKTMQLFTDSEYSINVITGKKNSEKNKDIIFKCQTLYKNINSKIKLEFVHIDAHSNKQDFIHKCNDIVDKLARKRAKEMSNAQQTSNRNLTDYPVLKAILDTLD